MIPDRRFIRLGNTDRQRRASLLSTIGHTSMHNAAPVLHDIPAGGILETTGRRLFGVGTITMDAAEMELRLLAAEAQSVEQKGSFDE